MKKAWIASLFALLLSLPGIATAVPQTLAFSARIADAGRPVTGGHTVKFAFWDCDGSDPLTCVDPANVLWSETQTLTVSDGVLTAVLGADTTTPNPLPSSIFNGSPLFLEVTFDGTAFSPRMAVHSVPYALRAGAVDSVKIGGNAGGSTDGMSITLVAGTNPMWPVTYVAPANGTCLVSTSSSLWWNNSATAPSNVFNYYYAAYRVNGGTPEAVFSSFYPLPIAGYVSNSAVSFNVSTIAGNTYDFGCNVNAPTESVGKRAFCKVAYICIAN